MSTLFAPQELAQLERHLTQPAVPAGYRPPQDFPRIRDAKKISLDLETHDPTIMTKGPGSRRDGYIVGVGLRTNDDLARYYPIAHVAGPNCDPDKTLAWLRDELKHFKGEIVGANVALYDGDYLQCAGVHAPQAKWRDVQWAEALLDETALSYSLETLGRKYLNESKATDGLKGLYGPAVMKHFREVHPAHAEAYSLQDTAMPLAILQKQEPLIKADGLTRLFDLECRLAPLLLYMKDLGVRVDLEKAEEASRILAQKRDESLSILEGIAGFPVDPEAGADIARACELLGVAYPMTDPTPSYPSGQPSFRKEWIVAQAAKSWLDELDPVLGFFTALHDARRFEKARNPFVTNYILAQNIKGRIHAEINPLRRAGDVGEYGTESGRFSYSHPNLQNIPARDAFLAPLLRSLFLPDEGMDFYTADYSQIEFRLIVNAAVKRNCTGAQDALDRYIRDPTTDFHNMVVELTGLSRKYAKNINFGLAFTMGVWMLAQNIGQANPDGSPKQEAYDVLKQYHQRVPFVKEISRKAADSAQAKGYMRTLLGRRSRFNLWEKDTEYGDNRSPVVTHEEAIKLWGDNIRRAETHKALNRYTQGSSADLTKLAMVKAWESGLFSNRPLATLALTIHDELAGSKARSEAGDKALADLKELMQEEVKGMVVPILVEAKTGANWMEAK